MAAAKGTRRAGRARGNAPQLAFSEALGVFGWRHLDPLLLGALAIEAPVLLIGRHGTAKSFLVERIAAALGLSFRHYNASLVNYDDLVGIPLPDETGGALRFVSTPEAIWGAEFVFVDEISRCRPDLQNKLFPIVHERRVAGRRIETLRHRWAAMNPPCTDDAVDKDEPTYLGSEPLDPALADRFAFVVEVPDWKELRAEDRRRLLGSAPCTSSADVADLVARTLDVRARLSEMVRDQVVEYVCSLVDLLQEADLPQSPRRARMLVETVLATQAATFVLDGSGISPPGPRTEKVLEEAAFLAVRHGLPQPAFGENARPAKVRAAHRQAWEVSRASFDLEWRAIFRETDPLMRVLTARRLKLDLQLDRSDLSRVVTEALSAVTSESRRIGMATALFVELRGSDELDPPAWEALAALAERVLRPGVIHSDSCAAHPELWRAINAAVPARPDATLRERLERNFLLSGFPDLWLATPWEEALSRFRADLDLVGVR